MCFVQEHELIPKNGSLVIGVSGGPDSVCLLHILAKLRKQLGIHIHVAHLNHGLRKSESEADAEYVARLSDQLGISATIERENVEAYRCQHHLTLEEAAREVRYNFFARVAHSIGTNRVATGHTADDQVETILMRLIRGTGAWGMRGIQPLSLRGLISQPSLVVIRPLLEVGHSDTQAYCQAHNLNPRIDSSNLSSLFLRNRIRHEVIPVLRTINPSVEKTLLHTTALLADEQSFLEEQVAQVWDRVVSCKKETLMLNTELICSFHPALQRCILREAFIRLLGDTNDIGRKHVEKAREALSLPAGKRVSLPRGLTLYVDYGNCFMGTETAPTPPIPPVQREMTLEVPGETVLSGWRVQATIQLREELDLAQALGDSKVHSVPGQRGLAYSYTACLDFDATGSELVTRIRHPGDKFQPLGMSSSKKLQDFMVDAHIPQYWRDRIPLVCSPNHIVWVVGWRIDDRVKVTEGTRRLLRLKFETVDPNYA